MEGKKLLSKIIIAATFLFSSVGAAEIPNNLVIPPAVYEYQGGNLDLSKEGMHRLLNYPTHVTQRITFKDDVKSLLAALSLLTSHGCTHDWLDLTDAKIMALTSKLSMTCGSAAQFAQAVLAEQGVKSRLCGGVAIGDYNDYNNGHAMLEVMVGGRYQVFDMSTKRLFKDSILSVCCQIVTECIPPHEVFHTQNLVASTPIMCNGIDLHLLCEEMLKDDASVLKWYRRVLQVPFIQEGDEFFYTCRDSDREVVGKQFYFWQYLKEQEFVEKFYTFQFQE